MNQNILTFWQGKVANGLTCGFGVISGFTQVNAARGLCMVCEAMLITERNTALIIAYEIVTIDMRPFGGKANQTMVNNIIQEIEPFSGKLMFEWNGAKYVPITDTYAPLPTDPEMAWDWMHVSAVKVDVDGNIIVSARNTWTVYKIEYPTGRVIWQLNGKRSSFEPSDPFFRWQNDVESIGDNQYLVFDNEGDGVASEAKVLRLDDRFVSVVEVFSHPDSLRTKWEGSVQKKNDIVLVGWGSTGWISAFQDQNLTWHASFQLGTYTNRAYYLDASAVSKRFNVEESESHFGS